MCVKVLFSRMIAPSSSLAFNDSSWSWSVCEWARVCFDAGSYLRAIVRVVSCSSSPCSSSSMWSYFYWRVQRNSDWARSVSRWIYAIPGCLLSSETLSDCRVQTSAEDSIFYRSFACRTFQITRAREKKKTIPAD